jgi:PAS domain S-box-containing protein
MTQAKPTHESELETLRRQVAELEAKQREQQSELDALRQSSQRLHTILERSPIVLFETDLESRFSFVEGKGLDRLGISSQHLLGRPSMDLYGSLPGVAERRASVLAGEPSEFTVQLAEDAIYRIWTAPSRNAAGEIVGTYGVAIDMTEQSHVESRLKEREEYFHMITSISPTGLYHSAANECVYANQRALEIAGLPPDEISNEAWRAVLHPDDRERVIRDWSAAISQKQRYISEYRFLRSDGQVVWVQGEAVPRLDGQGNVIGAVGAITDITAIKRAEQQLQSHHDWLQSIAATVPGAIAVYNIRTLRYSFVSEGFRELLGYAPQELLDGHFDWIIAHTHPEDFARAQGESQAAVAADDVKALHERNSDVKVFEYRMLHANGSWRWVRTLGTVFSRDSEGNIVEVLNVTLDINDRHEMEEQLRKSQHELEQRVTERTAEHAKTNESLRHEIQQRRATEVRVHEQNKLLGSVLNAMSDGVTVVDARGELVMKNKAADRILGLHEPRQSWRFDGRAFLPDCVTPIAYEQLPGSRALRGETVRDFEIYLAPNKHSIDGVWVRVNADPLRDERGVVAGAVIVFGDETARRKAIQALHESLARFNLMVDASQVGLWDAVVNQADPLDSNNPIYYSPHMATLLGYDPHEFGTTVGDWAKHVHPDDQPRVFAALTAHLEQNMPYDVEYRCITKQGKVRWFAARGGSIRDSQNRPLRLSGSFIDITARKKVEAELAEKEGQLRAMMDATNAVVYIKSVDGTYLYMNQEFEKLFNVRLEDFQGRNDFDLFPHDVAEAFRRNDQLVANSKEPVQFEEYAPQEDGLHTYVSVKYALRNSQGQAYATCGISTDITERKRSEERLREEQRFLHGLIEVQERDRQLMAYDIHDGLIQFITGSVMEIESLAVALKLSAEQRAKCDRVLEMLRHAINDGRRVLSGLRPPVLDASGIVVALEYLIAEQRKAYPLDVSLTQRVSFERLPPLIEATIYRIVQEALNNINKHSGAKRADVVVFQFDDKLRLTIRDDGHGFDPAKVEPSRFGLQGIRKRAALLGGSASIESSPGHGTTLSVTLPMTVRAIGEPAI